MSANHPARSTPQLDLMRRLKARDIQHGQLMSFLEDNERERLNRILKDSIEDGITDKVQRQSHDFLVLLGQRDASLHFLTEDERRELTALTRLEPPVAKASRKKLQPKKRSMSGGEFIVTIMVILSAVMAAYLIFVNPATNHSAIWVAVWGVLCGGGFITGTRQRSSTKDGSVSIPEGFLAGLVWAIAGTAVVLLTSHHVLSPGWAALLSFIGAGIIGRAILNIQDSDD